MEQINIGGMPGYQVTAAFDWDDGTPLKTTFYFLFSGDVEYQLVAQAAEQNWEADQAVFADFVDSFVPGQGM